MTLNRRSVGSIVWNVGGRGWTDLLDARRGRIECSPCSLLLVGFLFHDNAYLLLSDH